MFMAHSGDVWVCDASESGPTIESAPIISWPGEECRKMSGEANHADIMDGIANLNWQEIAMLFGEVEQHEGGSYGPVEHISKGLNKRKPSATIFDINDTIVPSVDQANTGYVPSYKTSKTNSGDALSEDLMNEIFSHVQIGEVAAPSIDSTAVETGTSETSRRINANDPAPVGSLTFEQVRDILLEAEKGNFDDTIKKRFGVSPINPNGPTKFYVIDRMCQDVSNIHAENEITKTKAVRSRSTKRLHWFAPDNTLGLRYRELAKKERKTGEILKFGGCTYELVRKIGNAIRAENVPQFLQIWPLAEVDNVPFGSVLGNGDIKDDGDKDVTVVEADSKSTGAEVAHFVYDVFNRHCDALQPVQFKKWSERYSKLLFSSDFASALKLYITRQDLRLKETFLFPTAMVQHREVGIFRGQMTEDIFSEGAMCTFADETFKGFVGVNPTGMTGFFNSLLSPLQRLCISRVWWAKLAAARQGIYTYFQTWKICQTAVTLHDRTQRVFRMAIRIVPDGDEYYFEVKTQDVSDMYPEIAKLQPFLA
uniref:Uncharacterized protein n=2 Tax=Mucochytrium quahogii TaxID=96639 RepID=A0A7S2RP77_9STRA|mmetsp:Transcript_14503/g.23606  ORF Transcript_14503/g.23606 Transcript_14503/m.23606 type:complete len:538 (+) Transcript_14503:335-1948(+)